MRKSLLLMSTLGLLLQGCASVPNVLVAAVCPRLPALEQVSQDVLERDYMGEMASFLRGTLVTPPNSGLGLKPATSNMAMPERQP